MLTDIKGFTSKTASFSRAETLDLLKRHKEMVLPVVGKFHGRLVKTIGDAFLVVFESPTDSVLCGVEIQNVLKAHNADKSPDERIEIRIAINSGEVAIEEDGDIYGDAVNITSRLESIAEAGEVFFTEAVYLAMNKKEVPSSEIGYRQFKGIPEKIKVFRVLREVPVGAGSADMPVSPVSLAQGGPAAETPAAAAQLHTPKLPERAGFWRRCAALALDAVFFLIITSSLGLRSCGPTAKVSGSKTKDVPDINIENIRINRSGLEITGEDGEKVVINKDGTDVTAKDGRKWKWNKRNQKSEIGVGTNKKKVPLSMLLWALYGGLLVWRFGATPGKMILKLRVVDFSTGEKIGVDKSFLRAFFSLVSLFLLLGYIWAIWEKDKRTWHDIIAGTKSVRI